MKPFFDPVERATKLSTALTQDLDKGNTDVPNVRYSSDFRRFQYDSTLKKVEVEGDIERLQLQAFDDFLHRNSKLADINRLLILNEPDDASVLGYVLRRARHVIGWALGDITTEEVFYACRHSNGVTQGVSYQDTSLNRKSTLPWSATESIAKLIDSYDRYDSSYRDACYQVSNSLAGAIRIAIVLGSRATTVPKRVDVRRMIAIEPTGNMFFQQGLMIVMYNRLAMLGLDVKTLPDRHRDLAFWASVSGSDATLDLSNASDSVALELVRYLFPKKWFKWLEQCRSPVMSVNGHDVRLEAYATMGNATTFPVETLVFWALGVGASMLYRQRRLYGVTPWKMQSLLSLPCDRKHSVFGDDIIISTEVVPSLTYCLVQLGFSINTEKSFFDRGPSFRESCGGDFFHGRAMRPWYIRGPTTTTRIGLEAWIYVMVNTLQRSYISYFGRINYIYEKRVYELMFKWLMEVTPLIKVVPSSFPDDSGLKGLEGLRLARCYLPDSKISPVGRTEQGWYNFRYLRFRFKQTKPIHEALTYAVWLKTQAVNEREYLRRWHSYLPIDRETIDTSPIRKKGVYIVARANSRSF